MGRPSLYSDELADEICARLACGDDLEQALDAEGMPDESTVYRWLLKDGAFREKYERARALGLEAWTWRMKRIADTPHEGVETEVGPDGKLVKEKHGDMLGHRRLQIDTMKWIMGKIAPKKYGEKVTQELTGADGGPIGVAATVTTPEQLAEAAKTLAAKI